MGRRKIEIKAIKDDRNRSVTFLKRKGGLFKKAYELSVLCSADVAIIIFGNNKKLYEFSSTPVDEILERRSYFGLPHERKGPEDYQGKASASDGDDDEDAEIDVANGMRQSNSPPVHQRTNSVPYGVGMPPRHLTPQPASLSRPLSRNAPHPHQRHLSGGALVGPNGQPIPHPAMGQPNPNGFTYVNQYNPAVTQAGVQNMPSGMVAGPAPGFNFPQNGAHPNGAQAFLQQQQHETLIRRQSMPSSLSQQVQHQHEQQVPPHIIPDQHPAAQHPSQIQVHNDTAMINGQDEQNLPEEQPNSDGITRLRTKSRSIFTPIAGENSLLAQHWFGPDKSPIRSNSIDVGAIARKNANAEAMAMAKAEPPQPESAGVEEDDPKILPLIRTGTGEIPPPTRTPSMISTPGGGLKRPVLKVQIPNDAEEDDPNTNTAGTSPRNSGLTADPLVGNSAPLSAGGSGPPNPRFVENMLPSPSAFFGTDWATVGLRAEDNLLPSPLNFKTPTTGRMYTEEDTNASKRKSPDTDSNVANCNYIYAVSSNPISRPPHDGKNAGLAMDGWRNRPAHRHSYEAYPWPRRHISTTRQTFKKNTRGGRDAHHDGEHYFSKKDRRDASVSSTTSPASSSAAAAADAANPDDPFDFTKFDESIKHATDSCRNEMTHIKAFSGRLDPTAVENLVVTISLAKKDGGGGGREAKMKLSELAHVAPKGRELILTVNDESYVNHIKNALLSQMSLNPQPLPSTPNILKIPIPMPTAESRQNTASLVQKAGQKWLDKLQHIRASQFTHLDRLSKAGKARPDDCRKAEKKAQEKLDRTNKELKQLIEKAKAEVVQS
ncbi:hypothetical protein Dda_1253 [Drechslerella dactyloides]|uniref:MADS-box domain-containing protein n=1 Tax=Drechslerella dactyloides TaxID=74499 RepID=A0AAD6J2N9_DREDA|nr:hypothetical protein Dda_1253 [Drechslerella dactyloides]